MSFSSYISTLLPSIDSVDIRDQLTIASENVTDSILPMAKSLQTVFPRDYKYKDKVSAKLIAEIARLRVSKLAAQAGAFERIEYVGNNLLTTIPLISEEINRQFNRYIATVSMTYSDANLIQYCEILEFWGKYTRVLLNYVSASELHALGGRGRVDGVGPMDAEYLQANLQHYIVVSEILLCDVNQLRTKIREIPKMPIDPSTEQETSVVVGDNKLNPFGFATLPWPVSMIYHARLNRVESQAEDFEETQATAAALQYRIILLEQRIKSGNGDAAVEKLLQIQNDRLMRTKRKIAELEAEYGIATR